MKKNYLEEGFKLKTLFLDESVFDPEYIPSKLLHRENELMLLSRLFLPLIKKPNSISKKLIIMGNVGVGKTVTVHCFGDMLKESAKKRNFNLKFIHINCRNNRTGYLILKSILTNLMEKIPDRGFSQGDLIKLLADLLKEKRCHLVLVLDEMGSILKKDSDLIYTLTRLNEVTFSGEQYLSIIGIVKNISILNNLDDATLSTLQNEVIKFKKYSSQQIFEILKDRISTGLKDGVVSDEILTMISELSAENGDMRMALKILKNSIKYSEKMFIDYIVPEGVRVANSEFFPLSYEELNQFNFHELLLLKGVCNNLIIQKKQKVPLNEIKEEYSALCAQYNIQPRGSTQIWEYIKDLKNHELISSNIINKKIKGRQSFISIKNYSIQKLKKEIDIILRRKS